MGPRSWDRGEYAVEANAVTSPIASMGPRSWDRGELQRYHVFTSIQGLLQWGRGLGTAESRRCTELQDALKELLQWGRGLGTAESLSSGHRWRRTETASMGPRSWDRGELMSTIKTTMTRTMLQWGRGLGTAESD